MADIFEQIDELIPDDFSTKPEAPEDEEAIPLAVGRLVFGGATTQRLYVQAATDITGVIPAYIPLDSTVSLRSFADVMGFWLTVASRDPELAAFIEADMAEVWDWVSNKEASDAVDDDIAHLRGHLMENVCKRGEQH